MFVFFIYVYYKFCSCIFFFFYFEGLGYRCVIFCRGCNCFMLFSGDVI